METHEYKRGATGDSTRDHQEFNSRRPGAHRGAQKGRAPRGRQHQRALYYRAVHTAVKPQSVHTRSPMREPRSA